MIFTIEKEVPIPDPDRTNCRNGTWKSLAQQMEIGDSVRVSGAGQSSSLQNAIRNLSPGCKSSQRVLPCPEGTPYNEKPFRIWRVA